MNKKTWLSLGYIGDEVLPNYVRITLNQYKFYKDLY